MFSAFIQHRSGFSLETRSFGMYRYEIFLRGATHQNHFSGLEASFHFFPLPLPTLLREVLMLCLVHHCRLIEAAWRRFQHVHLPPPAQRQSACSRFAGLMGVSVGGQHRWRMDASQELVQCRNSDEGWIDGWMDALIDGLWIDEILEEWVMHG